MPPKAKKKQKSGKKKKGKKSGDQSTKGSTGATEQLSELSKEFYLIQIRDLEDRLNRYQKKCDELDVMGGKFREKYDQLATDKKEIESFLKKSLKQRGDEIDDLNDRLIGIQQAKDAEKEHYEQQLQQLRTEFQETKDQLTSENMLLGGKLASLEEFKVQKDDLMAKFAELELQLTEKEEGHKEHVYNLERKQVIDKDRLKKEMVAKVNQVAAEFRKVSNKQMAETTKRTIRENVSINAQLGKMSDKTLELIQENDEARDREKKYKQQIDLLEANEKELAKKNHSNQKIIRMLTEKCKNQEAIIAEFESREQEYQDIDSEAELLRQQVESTRHELQSLSKENELLQEEVARGMEELAKEQKQRRKIERVLAESASSIRHMLTTRTSEDAQDTEFEAAERRDGMLEGLLVLLNSAAAVGLGPSPGDFTDAEGHGRARSPSQMPGSGLGIQRGELPQSPLSKTGGGTLPHYQLGDLGLIPRPQQHIPTHTEKIKELSETTRKAGIRRVLTKEVAVQTVSTPKAMFFADQLLSKVPQSERVMHGLDSDRPTFPPIPSSKMATKAF